MNLSGSAGRSGDRLAMELFTLKFINLEVESSRPEGDIS
jgi:hypothetical protein